MILRQTVIALFRTIDVFQLFLLFSLLFIISCHSRPDANKLKAELLVYEDGKIEQRLKELQVELYDLPAPTANYVRAIQSGNLIFLSGHGPMSPEGKYTTGKVGKELSIEEGKTAARNAAITLLSALKEKIGDLDKVSGIVKVHGMVNSTPEFTEHSTVMNGCSDFLVEVFGEKGKHARAAVGMGSLPGNMAVEIEMVVEITN